MPGLIDSSYHCSHRNLDAILKLLALRTQSSCSVSKDPGSYSHKGLEASKDLGTEKGALPLLAGTQARQLFGLPMLILWLEELAETQ